MAVSAGIAAGQPPRRSILRRWFGKAYGDYPPWKRKLILHTTLLWALLAAHAGFLVWTRRYDPNISSFWGAYGFDVLGIATDCSILRQQQLAWTLAVNILATLISYVSTDVLMALCAPNRRQLDASHATREHLEIGVHSFRNIRSPHFGWTKRILWVLLSLLILPFHLIYNSVIIVSQPASESYQISIPDSLIPLGAQVSVSQSVYDPAGTQAALSLAVAATHTPGLISSGAIPTASAVTAVVAAATNAPSACNGPSNTNSIPTGDYPQATVQPNINQDCNKYALAPCGMACQDFISQLDVSLSQFLGLNPDISLSKAGTCENFFGGYTYCVASSSSAQRRSDFDSFVARASDSSLQISDSEVAGAVEPVQHWENFNNYKSTYMTSPLLEFETADPNNWPGLHVATEDLNNLLSQAYFSSNAPTWNDLTINSSDWIPLSLDSCRQQFSERYRPNTGTVVLILSGLNTDESVVGLSYLSYDWTDVMVSCPTSFLQGTPGGTEVIQAENPPLLPLMFGTFEDKTATQPKEVTAKFAGTQFVCPYTYSASQDYSPATQPVVEGCLLKGRNSVCRMGVNILFTVILLFALTLKAVLMTIALFEIEEDPILTVGDAMAEYLERPDTSVANCSLSWTEDEGWIIVDGAIMAYQHGRSRGNGEERVEIRWKDGHWLWLRTWPGRQWRKVWGYSDMGRSGAVPKSDIFNNLHTMRSVDPVVWLGAYLWTLAVCFGIFYSIGSQNGWTIQPGGNQDLYWMLWPTILCNLPQLFATIRAFTDTRILTARSSLEDFASYATNRRGLAVSEPERHTAQRPVYFFGGMNALVFATTTGLQTLYAWIISQFAQPQWVNPLRPNDPPDYFSPAFLMRFGTDANRSLVGNICFGILIVLFPFLAVHLVNMTQSLVVRVRTLRIEELSTFIPQYLADVLLLRWVAQFGRPEKTARLLPLVPLQMPGPATSSLVLALVCQPRGSDRQPGLSKQPLQWGVVQPPCHSSGTAEQREKLGRQTTNSTAMSTLPVMTTAAPIRVSVSRKPMPVRTASSIAAEENKDDDVDAPMSPTMSGAPHLSGDEAAFATAWFDMTGVPAGERSPPPTQRAASPRSGAASPNPSYHSHSHSQSFSPAQSPRPRSVPPSLIQPASPPFHRTHTIDEEKGGASATVDEAALSTAPSTDLNHHYSHQYPSHLTDEGWTPGHCAFSAGEVFELEPGRSYTGIRRGEGNLSLRRQVEQLARTFLRVILLVEFPEPGTERGRNNHRHMANEAGLP